MVRWKITGFTVGTPLIAAGLSWEYPDSPGKAARGLNGRLLALANGKPPKVRQVTDPIVLGVHPSSPAPPGTRGPADEPVLVRVPAYVPRDIDAELRGCLARSGFVVVVGDSTAGKTRAAYQAIADLGDHLLVVPEGRDALPSALSAAARARRCVLWLDDLENYLGTGGLTRAAVTQLVTDRRSHRVVVATLRAAEESVLVAESAGGQDGLLAGREARRVLELAHRIVLSRMFSQSEKTQAQARAWDPRIADALAQSEKYGLAEYLAAGPELLRDWESAWNANTNPRAPTNPRGAAIVAAAVDLRRGGYLSPLPRALLERVHYRYLRAHGGSRLRPESVAEAWAWAVRPRRATTALLDVVGEDSVQVFDYLVDTVQRRSGAGDYVPDVVLEAGLAVSGPQDAVGIADTAYNNGRYELSEKAYLSAYQALSAVAGAEHSDTLHIREGHANVLRELDRYEECEAEHAAVAEITARVYGAEHPLTLRSRTGRAFALIRLQRHAEAEQELAAVGDISARVLGPEDDITLTSRHIRAIALQRMGRLTEAEAENRAVLAAWTRDFGPENPSTLYSRGNLAWVLYSSGRTADAEAEYRAVLDICIRTLGPEHPDTLYIQSRLSSVQAHEE